MAENSQTVIESFVKSFVSKNPIDEDVEDFGKRIFSYIEDQKWASRPLILSPSVCARYGWKCINSNLLECVTCGAKLCTQEPKIEVYEAYKACIEKIFKDLKDSHKTQCPWPLAPSPESLVKMIALPKEDAMSQFVKRLKPCLQFECLIPQVDELALTLLGLNQQHIQGLCKLADISAEDVHLIGTSVVCIAATGWTLVSKTNSSLNTNLKCENCQRSIWVKSFNLINTLGTEESTSSENGKATELASEDSDNDAVNGSPRKKMKLEKIDFNPLEEHRPWCMWVSSNADNTSLFIKKESEEDTKECLPGWKIFMQSLLKNLSDSQNSNSENSPSKEQLRNVRSLMESWTSPK